MDFWDGETLETITESFGKLLKVDEQTMSLERTHFARLCLKINFSKPLKIGYLLEDNNKKVTHGTIAVWWDTMLIPAVSGERSPMVVYLLVSVLVTLGVN